MCEKIFNERYKLPYNDAFAIYCKYFEFEKCYTNKINDFLKQSYYNDNFISNQTNNKYVRLLKPMKAGYTCCAAYIIKHRTGIYVGSTVGINSRVGEYEKNLYKNRGENCNLLRAFNSDPDVQFYFILVNTRDEAYDIEQWLLDRFWDSNVLFNRQPNAKNSTGILVSDKTKEKLRLLKIGIKQTPEHIENRMKKIHLSGRKINNKNSLKSLQERSIRMSKPVSIEGNRYNSVKIAGKILGIQRSTIQKRVKSNSLLFKDWFWLNK